MIPSATTWRGGVFLGQSPVSAPRGSAGTGIGLGADDAAKSTTPFGCYDESTMAGAGAGGAFQGVGGNGSRVAATCASIGAIAAAGSALRRRGRGQARCSMDAVAPCSRSSLRAGFGRSLSSAADCSDGGSSLAGFTLVKCTVPTGASSAHDQGLAKKQRSACRAMFERFTDKSMKAVMMAQNESRKLGHDHVGTEMLVMGIIAEGSDIGALALLQLGVDREDARAALENLVGRGTGGKAIEVPFTQGAKQALEDAIDSARNEGSALVGTSHLLRAVLRRKEGGGTRLLQQMLSCHTAEAVLQQLLPALAAGSRELSRPASAADQRKSADQRQAAGSGAVSSISSTPSGGVVAEMDLTETLKYASDLTQLAREGRLDPMVGREREFDRTVRILGRRSKNNPVLVGEAGVGKTSIAHGLAQRIVEGRVPQSLRDKRVLQLDLALLLAGTRYRGDFEERLRAVVGEVTACGRRVVLVIDEVHTLVGAGSGGGEDSSGIDAANLLKPALARGELQCIGATTLDEYRTHIEKDPALERRFQPVHVAEPSEEEAEQILEGIAPRYEQFHQLKYTPEALKAAVKLAAQYVSDRCLPDKAIDVIDEAGSKVRQQVYQALEGEEVQKELRSLRVELGTVREKKKAAVAVERYDEAHSLKVREVALVERLDTLEGTTRSSSASGGSIAGRLLEELQAIREQLQQEVAAERFSEAFDLKVRERELLEQLDGIAGNGVPGSASAMLDQRVTEADVAQVVATWTGIPVEQVNANESARLMRLEVELHESIIGQLEAVSSVSRALRRARVGLRNPTRPIASFMFSGPTGVGKTELCKTLAASFFGSEDSMIRMDMSEFMERHTVSKLIGAPPGYVGYGEGGALTESVRRRPYSLVLFDEVEKAHPDVFNLLLQLLDDGRLTDSKGRTVSFANTLVVMTSNIGSRSVQRGAAGGLGLGFGTDDSEEDVSYSVVKDLVLEEMKGFFRPEFLNRLDETVIFRPLTRTNVREIAEVEFRKVLKRMTEQKLDVALTDGFKELVVERGFDPANGARPLRRAIMRLLEDKLAEYLLSIMEAEGPRENASASGSDDTARRLLVDVDSSGKVVLASREKSRVMVPA